MEHYDSQMAARVWQRVQNSDTRTTSTPDILSFLQAESADLSRYRQLFNQHSFAGKPELPLLIAKTQQCVNSLRGIWFLLKDAYPDTITSPLPKELPVSSLRSCYGRTLQRISHYDLWTQHAEYAPGFLLLSQLSRERCQLLLQLLGGK